nr:MAG TPA: hypothetical protein [Caudoviricetes sp.]
MFQVVLIHSSTKILCTTYYTLFHFINQVNQSKYLLKFSNLYF